PHRARLHQRGNGRHAVDQREDGRDPPLAHQPEAARPFDRRADPTGGAARPDLALTTQASGAPRRAPGDAPPPLVVSIAPVATHPLAGKVAPRALLADVPRLVSAYYTLPPDAAVPGERVAFGTSGHRGSSLKRAFNEPHILAVTQAICLYRKQNGIDGPLFLGKDTHALS